MWAALLLLPVAAALCAIPGRTQAEGEPWWDYSWGSRVRLTFDNTGQAENLVDFPVLVTLNSGRVDYSQIQDAGQDLRFVDADGATVLAHEIEAWNESGDSYVWVKIPQIDGSSSSDFIFLYYDNPTAPDGQDVANVWDGQFRGVWHLNETSGAAEDSTSFGTSGALTGGVTQGAAGRIDGAYEFDGVNGVVNMGDPADGHLDFGTGSFTYEAWVNIDQTTGTYQIVVDKGGSNAFTPGYEMSTNETAEYYYGAVGDGSSNVLAGSVPFSLDTWYYFAVVADRGSDELRVYQDGGLQPYIGDLSSIGGVDSPEVFRLSRTDFPVDGWVDEVRVSSGVRSADWIAAQHQSMSGAMVSYGAAESPTPTPTDTPTPTSTSGPAWWDCDWDYRAKLTFDNAAQAENLVDFPVLVTLNSGRVDYSQIQDAGQDLRFVDTDGATVLAHEIEAWDESGDSLVWVRVPQIDASSGSDYIWLYYGNPSAADGQNVAGVWSANYSGVWHLKEDPGGTAPQMLDSTSNGSHGTTAGGMTSGQQVPGRIGGALNFDGSSDYVWGSIPAALTTYTYEAWINRSTTLTPEDHILALNDTQFFVEVDDTLEAGTGSEFNINGPTSILAGTWYHVAFVQEAAGWTIYLDGQVEVSGPQTTAPGSDFHIGVVYNVPAGGYFPGLIDEARISDTPRSADWMAAQYQSMTDALISYGAVEPSSGYCAATATPTPTETPTPTATPVLAPCLGDDGIVTTDIGGGNDAGNAAALQLDGKIVVAGWSHNGSNYDTAVARYVSDGSLDASFGGGDGIVTTAMVPGDDFGTGVTLQADGKIVVVGRANGDFGVVRYNPDGTLDTSFGGGDGMVTTDFALGDDTAEDVAVQPDGKIVVAGYGLNYDFAVVRYNADGSLDTSFGGGDGMVTTAIGTGDDQGKEMGLQSDGKIVVAGYSHNGSNYDFAVVRYNADGGLDASFGGGDGIVTTAIGSGTDVGWTMAIQTDGKILVGGRSVIGVGSSFAVVRYNADGSLDSSFGGGDGIVTTDMGVSEIAWGMALQEDGKIVLGGEYYGATRDFVVARYNPDGSLDTTFDGDGIVITPIGVGDDTASAVVIQPDGKIVAVGYSNNGPNDDMAVVRYTSAGAFDACAAPTETPTETPTPTPTPTATATDVTTGKMYWADRTSSKIQRANLDGSNVEDLVTSGLSSPMGIALDLVNDKMYWTEVGGLRIQRANLDGSNVEPLVTSGLTYPYGIALDVPGGKMYWVDRSAIKIQRANLDGTGVEDLVTTGINSPQGIALDTAAGKMYWTDYDNVQRANLDGTGVEELVTGLYGPNGIALDLTAGKMYWVEEGATTPEIQRANMDGSNVEALITSGLTDPKGIALDVTAGKMYWTESDSLTDIRRANLDGTNVQDLVAGVDRARGIDLDVDVPGPTSTPTPTPTETNTPTPTPTATATSAWWDCDWGYRVKLDMDNTGRAENLVDFPMLVTLNSGRVDYGEIQDAGQDLRFVDAGGATVLAHEIEAWDESGGSLVWVRVPQIDASSGSDYIWLYYGNPSAADGQNVAGVWNTDYVGVWHLNEAPSGAPDEIQDSTTWANHGTSQGGMSAGNQGPGRIDGSLDFDGSDDVINSGNDTTLELTSQGTLEGWVRWDALNTYDFIVGKSVSGTAPGVSYGMSKANTGRMRVGVSDGTTTDWTATEVNAFNTGQWYYFVGRWDGSQLQMFVDGSPNGTPMAQNRNAQVNAAHNVTIGCGYSATCGPVSGTAIDGRIDEVRISDVPRTDGWIAAQYQSMTDALISYGAPEASAGYCAATATPTPTGAWDPCGWGYRKKITIHHTKVSGTQTDFPVLINLSSDSDLSSEAQADGDDIVFTSSDGTTKLSHEIESFTKSTGALTAWVKVPSLSSATDTDLYLYYGNSTTPSQQDPTGVWDANYGGVWHLGEAVTDNTVASGAHTDSTSSGNNGDQINNNDVAGKIGVGQDFEGDVQDEYIEIPNSPSMENIQEGDYTLEAWFNSDVTPPGTDSEWDACYGIVIKRDNHIGLRFEHEMDFASDHYLTGLVEVWVSGEVKNNNQWYHVVGVVDRTNGSHKLYVNGVNEDTNTFTPGATAYEYDTLPWRFGIADTGRVDWAWPANGKIDEVRLSSTARSPEWILTEFNNQDSPSTFYSVGSEEVAPCGTPTPTPTSTTGPAWWDCDWDYRAKLTLDNAAQAENLVDFPVLVTLNSGRVDYSQIQDAGQDLRFVDADGATVLAHEIEAWNESGDSYVWVKVPQIDGASSSDYIWLYYGNASAPDGQNAAGVWSANYSGVWHLKEDPGGAAPQMMDSTSNGSHGTTAGGMTSGQQVPGAIGGALNFDGSSDYVWGSITVAPTTYTYEAWINRSTMLTPEDHILDLTDTQFFVETNDKLEAGTGFEFDINGPTSILAGTWYHAAFVQEAAGWTIYLDGQVEASGPQTTSPGSDFYIGVYFNIPEAGYFPGLIDEARISDTPRSADWMAAQYQSMSDTFISYGAAEPSGVYCAATATPTPTDTPTATPTDTPTATPTDTPTATPTDTPTATPTPFGEVTTSGISFPGTTLNGTDQLITGSTSPWQVQSTYPQGTTWHVNLRATDFSDGSHTIAVSNFEARLLDSNISGTDKPSSQMPAFTPLDTSDQQLLAYSGSNGQDTFTLTPDFRLYVPASSYQGSYGSTVTTTYILGP